MRGQTAGILSDSFAQADNRDADTMPDTGVAGTLTGSPSQDSMDLPPSVNLRDDAAGADEGAAMGELIHDMAPGAQIAFHSTNTPAVFAEGIDRLCAPVAQGGAGATVAVDDIGFFNEAHYQDDITAKAAANCVASGRARCRQPRTFRSTARRSTCWASASAVNSEPQIVVNPSTLGTLPILFGIRHVGGWPQSVYGARVERAA